MSNQPMVERFLRYTAVNTTVDPDNPTIPSSPGQWTLARMLVDEMRAMGLKDIFLLENSICGGTLPANHPEMNAVSLIAHMDTAKDVEGDTKARVVRYLGQDIPLGAQYTLSEREEPELSRYRGQELIVTSGDSLLGADNKAAIAEMLTVITHFQSHPEQPHGTIQVIFVPDEEKGLFGAKALDMSFVQGDYGICLDCGGIGEYTVETWCAASARITFAGKTAHPVNAKGRLVNSILQATELISELPAEERPEHTEGKEGFFFVHTIAGTTGQTWIKVNMRDFDRQQLEIRKETLSQLTGRFPGATIEIIDEHGNCGPELDKHPSLLQTIKQGMTSLGITPLPIAMRGGFDGSALCLKGLPTLNIFSGGHNFHSVKEYLPIPSMEKAVELACHVIQHAKIDRRPERREPTQRESVLNRANSD